MVKALLFDLARVLLFPKDKGYPGELNARHLLLSQKSNYRFLDYFELNRELLDFITSIKDKVRIYMFTSGRIQNAPEIRDEVSKVFLKIFSAQGMGISKSDPKSYTIVAQQIGLPPNEILFIDDNLGNLEAAKTAGFEIFQYKDNGIIKELSSKLNV